MVEYLCIIQARINSTRLPSKIMLDLAGKTILERVYESVSKSKKIDEIVVSTSIEQTDDIVELKLNELKISCFRGDLDNVLKRFYDTANHYNAKNIIRITADNPLMDGTIIDNLIELFESKNTDYSMFSNAIYGLSAEVFTFNSLKLAYINAKSDFDKEHVTPYIKNNSKCYITDITEKYKLPEISATVDTLDDYIKINKFYMFCQKQDCSMDINNFIKYQVKKSNINVT